MEAQTLHVRSFMDGFYLTFGGDLVVTDECGQLITYPTIEEANEVRKMTGRELDAWMKRASVERIESVLNPPFRRPENNNQLPKGAA